MLIFGASNEDEEIIAPPPARLWLIFFASPRGVSWWCRVLRPGWRHCYAACWYASEERWVVFNPTRCGIVIRLYGRDEFGAPLAAFLDESVAVLRVASRYERGTPPAMPWCVGQVKALLGIRSWAMTPFGLYRDLRARGAEVVEPPCVAAEPEAAAPSGA
jgi:hypothetical protein